MRLSDIRIRDPFILESPPGAYVLFGTTDENVWGGPATGFDCYTSTDLDTWDGPIAAFRPPDGFWSSTQYWAPEVHEHHGRFYMFATFVSSESRVRGVAVLTSDTPTGPFAPWSEGPITPADTPCLDGTFFVDDRSQPWLVYSRGSEGVPGGGAGIADGEMYAVRLSEDLREPVGAPELLFTASSAEWSRPLRFPDGVVPPPELNLAKDPLFTDGPFLVRSPSGGLLMLWSSFGDEGYAMGVATSDGGSILGPWTQNRTPLWARNGGHGMVLGASNGAQYLVFHAPNDTPDERAKLVEVVITAHGIELVEQDLAPGWRPLPYRPPLADEQPNHPRGARRHEGLTYAAVPGYRPLLMDLHVPEGVPEAPCIVWIHGGAFLTGDRRLPPALWTPGALFQKIVDAGFAVATIDYRHSREAPFPAQLHDVKAAVRYLRGFAEDLGLDPGRIAVWGESAGSQLAMLAALTADRADLEGAIGLTGPSSAVAAVVDWYGRADASDPDEGPPVPLPGWDAPADVRLRMPMDILLDGSPLGADAVSLASVTLQVHAGAPPFLVVHGEDDRLIPIAQSEALVKRLRQAGVEVDFRRVPGADHVFMGTDAAPLMDEAIDWLRATLT